jgi:aminopeptidase N
MRDNDAPVPVRLADYQPPAFLVDAVDLYVDIRDGQTRVTAQLALHRNPLRGDGGPLVLDGTGLETREVALDGVALEAGEFRVDDDKLLIDAVPDSFRLRTVVDIRPEQNTALEGLYMSHGMYCTQCEAEGFRRITWYPDRPDVLARFTTTIEADAQCFPLLLSNGNRTAHEQLPAGRHRATWQDPFPKPSYLFALVAADLACAEDAFITASGRRVDLRIYVEPHDLDKTAHAMESLKRAMRWDEEVYGREYDLDIYMIVAVSHFNMGAMENKGLNIFNTSCVLAHPATQTDMAFQRVEAVVAHEYFHNWSGNRVTCRDWFQLSLKEGFTVFRDAEFSKDMHSRAVKRIEEANFLRSVQFAEDSGPLAHPVRPESYVEINNFYTVTIYEKGAEVVRMLHTLIGAEGFRRGSDLYFARHDGQAATCEDFVRAMEEANDVDLAQFRLWYSQAGTPRVSVEEAFDAGRGEYTLRFRQALPSTPGQADKQPQVIPVALGLLDSQTGAELPLQTAHPDVLRVDGHLLCVLRDAETRVVFAGLEAQPVPSLLRGFSAPVHLEIELSDTRLAFLAAKDSDLFNRWDAAQRLYLRHLCSAIAAVGRAVGPATNEVPPLPDVLVEVFASVLARADEDRALAAEMLVLPSESYLMDQFDQCDPDRVRAVRERWRAELGRRLATQLRAGWQALAPQGAWSAAAGEVARRRLRNELLSLLAAADPDGVTAEVEQQYHRADNMTDMAGALRAGVYHGVPGSDGLLADFARRWRHEALVMDQWFSLQVSGPAIEAVGRAAQLVQHPDFDWLIPNRVRSVLGALGNNPVAFHRADGAGYRLLGDALGRLDGSNPQIAARLAAAFARWKHVDEARQAHAAAVMDGLLARKELSPNLREVLQRTRG